MDAQKEKEKLKILLLPKYNRSGPSSRYRFYNYLEIIESNNYKYDIKPLLGDNFIKHLFIEGKKSIFLTILGFIKRFALLFKIFYYDLIIIEYELFPFFPAIFERILRVLRIKYIVDYDDAIFIKYENNSNPIIKLLLKNKIKTVVKNSEAVITANKFIYEYAKKHNENVYIIPTVVSRKKYDNSTVTEKSNYFIVGWIGTPQTSYYLLDILPELKKLNIENFRINLIGTDKNILKFCNDTKFNFIEWKEETEILEIKKFNVGIMPLDNNPWSMGKSGFKIIQYMACKLPVIASPVGINCELVENGYNGFLVKTPEEWREAIMILYNNPEKAHEMGINGYIKFCRYYSLESVSLKYMSIINSIIK